MVAGDLWRHAKNSRQLNSQGGDVWMSVEEIASIAAMIVQGLDYLHGRGMVHNDLKPDNILLFPDGKGGFTAKLTDFGLAYFLPAQAAELLVPATHRQLLGTVPYAAPEALNREAFDFKVRHSDH